MNPALSSALITTMPVFAIGLENDLMNSLSEKSIVELKLIEDLTDGETLSVRVGFKWNPDKHPLEPATR